MTRAFPRPCTHSSQRCSTLGPLEQPLALCAMRARRYAGTLWLYLVRVEVVRVEVVRAAGQTVCDPTGRIALVPGWAMMTFKG